MKIRLNYWQLLLLLLPFIAGITLNFKYFTHTVPFTYLLDARVMNFFLTLSMCLMVCYQAYLGINFNNSRPNRSEWFNFNAYIPVVFNVAYLLYEICFTWILPVHNHLSPGPIKKSDLNPTSLVIIVLLIQTAITFLFVNTQYVSKRIKLITDIEQREDAKIDFLNPMRKLLKLSIIVVASSLLISIMVDIITFGVMSK
ncbi:hypothetical protein [Mucilaginibacter sp. FT3.2]|uniref:hypothetical protein n=1 Tax=Mucilaginibacter sp. FT3.2 TaxID=2723090 RepID=UPI001614196A|nr:hypothetical protein [Mucilaginibacter sp. FT3.2]MBB6235237.1 hypothetical protein [Mucilaginibacter sp. FT3.2]